MVRAKVVRLVPQPDRRRPIRDAQGGRWRALRTAAMVTGWFFGRVRDVD